MTVSFKRLCTLCRKLGIPEPDWGVEWSGDGPVFVSKYDSTVAHLEGRLFVLGKEVKKP